jgi:hypothetical protein
MKQNNSNSFVTDEGIFIYQSVGHIPNSLSYLFAILLLLLLLLTLTVSGFKYNQPEYDVSLSIPRLIVEYPTIITQTFEAYMRISMVD